MYSIFHFNEKALSFEVRHSEASRVRSKGPLLFWQLKFCTVQDTLSWHAWHRYLHSVALRALDMSMQIGSLQWAMHAKAFHAAALLKCTWPNNNFTGFSPYKNILRDFCSGAAAHLCRTSLLMQVCACGKCSGEPASLTSSVGLAESCWVQVRIKRLVAMLVAMHNTNLWTCEK